MNPGWGCPIKGAQLRVPNCRSRPRFSALARVRPRSTIRHPTFRPSPVGEGAQLSTVKGAQSETIRPRRPSSCRTSRGFLGLVCRPWFPPSRKPPLTPRPSSSAGCRHGVFTPLPVPALAVFLHLPMGQRPGFPRGLAGDRLTVLPDISGFLQIGSTGVAPTKSSPRKQKESPS